MTTYSQIKNGLDEIALKNNKYRNMIKDARSALVTAQSALNQMQTDYTAFIAEVDAEVAAHPTDEAYIFAGAEKNLLVSDFQALKLYAADLIAAFDGVVE